MNNRAQRGFLTALVIFGAVVFGMVLAGGLDLTSESTGSPSPAVEGQASPSRLWQ